MATNEPDETGDDFPIPEKKPLPLSPAMIALTGGLIALLALLALSY